MIKRIEARRYGRRRKNDRVGGGGGGGWEGEVGRRGASTSDGMAGVRDSAARYSGSLSSSRPILVLRIRRCNKYQS